MGDDTNEEVLTWNVKSLSLVTQDPSDLSSVRNHTVQPFTT